MSTKPVSLCPRDRVRTESEARAVLRNFKRRAAGVADAMDGLGTVRDVSLSPKKFLNSILRQAKRL